MSTSSPSILYLGLDVHKESVTIAVLPADAPAPTQLERVPYDLKSSTASSRAWRRTAPSSCGLL